MPVWDAFGAHYLLGELGFFFSSSSSSSTRLVVPFAKTKTRLCDLDTAPPATTPRVPESRDSCLVGHMLPSIGQPLTVLVWNANFEAQSEKKKKRRECLLFPNRNSNETLGLRLGVVIVVGCGWFIVCGCGMSMSSAEN